MQILKKILVELEEFGLNVKEFKPYDFQYPLVVIEYLVQSGRYRGQVFNLGIGFQEDTYPEYPPHWICIECLPDSKIHHHSEFTHNGSNWKVFSVPPSDFWDMLAVDEKNMKTFLNRHLARFWSQL